ncbi:uncharacterized protein LOC131438633 [Malaya genurostris]|uniref:uncharacterized protein LOC131438633 n=1 Tax=Malaya genurostris TaxID=325434 RepID=UPI0026F3F45C|nr:uncharacterized protein LOC131438633 [Malaya genurostris]
MIKIQAGVIIVVVLQYFPITQFAYGAAIVVLVANGSDITINLPVENNNNRLLNVISDSGNNNPSIFDWIGGNGANKAPRVSVDGSSQWRSKQLFNETFARLESLRSVESSSDEPNSDIDENQTSNVSIREHIIGDGSEPVDSSSPKTTQTIATTTLEANNESWKRNYVTVEMRKWD